MKSLKIYAVIYHPSYSIQFFIFELLSGLQLYLHWLFNICSYAIFSEFVYINIVFYSCVKAEVTYPSRSLLEMSENKICSPCCLTSQVYYSSLKC